MAKIVEKIVVLKFSALVKERDEQEPEITDEIKVAIEQVAQELAGTDWIVEAQ